MRESSFGRSEAIPMKSGWLYSAASAVARKVYRAHRFGPQAPDSELVARVMEALQRGNEHAAKQIFQQLVERYQARVSAVAFAILRSREDAEEVAQESFVKAYLSLNEFRGDSSFYTWLYRIVYNMAIDLRRRGNRRGGPSELFDESAHSTSTGLPSAHGDVESPDSSVLRREQRALIQRVLGELSEEHRTVIILREVEGLSYDEIAAAIGVSKGTVMSRLHYARKRMQSALHEFAPERYHGGDRSHEGFDPSKGSEGAVAENSATRKIRGGI